MKPKTVFMKMFNKLPEKARKELIYSSYEQPMSLNIVATEVKLNTKLGKEILEKLGFIE